MIKGLLKRLFLALFKEEIEALDNELRAHIDTTKDEVAGELLNDSSFIYDVTQEIIFNRDIIDEIKDDLTESLDALESRIDELEEEISK